MHSISSKKNKSTLKIASLFSLTSPPSPPPPTFSTDLMPAQKRPRDSTTPPPPSPPDAEQGDDSPRGSENHSPEQPQDVSDSDCSSDSSGGEKDEFIVVKLAEVRKEVQCPICLGIIRKTRTVMECLHRFCRECIDKSMRLGNNECPACRTHCASRRSLRDDPNYDALIAALYPDIDKYEEELAFHEEERARNKQIQASIAQTFRRQAEALGKKRTTRATSATFVRRQGNHRNLRGRRNRAAERNGSDEEEGINGHDEGKDSSSTDEHSEAKTKRYKRWGGARRSQPSPGGSGDDADDSEATRGILGASSTPHGSTELIAWGRGRNRSNTRHGGLNWTNGRVTRGHRLSKLTNRLKSLHESDEMLKISVMIVSLHEEKIPNLKRPYLCCSPTSSVRHLCQYVAMQSSMEATEIEMLIIKDFHPVNNSLILPKESGALDPNQNELHLLDEQQTLEEINVKFTQHHLVFAYRPKAKREGN